MAGVRFFHPVAGELLLRLAPTSVDWTYNLNTKVIDTYAGQVVQLLSINWNNLSITGRFGREGPHGAFSDPLKFRERPVAEFNDWKQVHGRGDKTTGLSQMTAYFKRYFQIASQGLGTTGKDGRGRYDQHPMEIDYSGGIDPFERSWTVYPTSMPSFSRANDEFAPEWKLDCEIEHADGTLHTATMSKELAHLKEIHFGYIPFNRFSDPLGRFLPNDFGTNKKLKPAKRAAAVKFAEAQLELYNDDLSDKWKALLPAYTDQQIEELLFFASSIPKKVRAQPTDDSTSSGTTPAHKPTAKQKAAQDAQDRARHGGER